LKRRIALRLSSLEKAEIHRLKELAQESLKDLFEDFGRFLAPGLRDDVRGRELICELPSRITERVIRFT
jgi:hypothetical protein